MSSKVQPPYPLFHDIDGRPLDAGYIYIGEAGKNPEVYPIPVFWDENLTVPAEQPIRTRNGFFAKNGRAGKIFVSNADCSITVKNKKKVVVSTDLFSDLFFDQKNIVSTVKSIADLAALEVWPGRTVFIKTRNGEENSLFAGTFVYSQNSTEEVDNGIVLNAVGGRWIRKIENNVIKAQWFGTPNSIDDQKILNPAFNASRKYKLFLDITGNEWGINGVVSVLDRVSLISNFDSVIHANPSGDYPRKFAIEFGLPGSVWNQNGCVLTNTGFLRVVCKNRDTSLHGVFLKGPLSNVDIIRTENFNGTGIKLESVHDTPFNRLSVEFCGNEEDYAFVCGSADDTTNCININALQVEQSYQRGIYITNTIRSVINNIHSERLFRTNQAPVDNLIGYDLNHVIQMSNSVINQALIHSNNGDIYVRLDGAVNNYNNFFSVHDKNR